MGGSSSKSTVEQTTELIYNSTNSFMSENSTKVAATNANINSLSLRGTELVGCPLKITQSIDAKTAATGFLTSEKLTDLSAKLQADVSSAIDNAASQTTGMLAATGGNSAEAVTDLKSKVTKNISNTISSRNVQDIMAAAANTNLSDLSGMKITCTSSETMPGISIDQNILSSVAAQAVTSEIMKNLVKDETIMAVTTDAKQSATQKNDGLNDLVDSIGKMISGPFLMIAGVVVVALIIFMVIAKSDAGQNAIRTGSAAAASKMGGGGGGFPANYRNTSRY
jgi:hypothetical protein